MTDPTPPELPDHGECACCGHIIAVERTYCRMCSALDWNGDRRPTDMMSRADGARFFRAFLDAVDERNTLRNGAPE